MTVQSPCWKSLHFLISSNSSNFSRSHSLIQTPSRLEKLAQPRLWVRSPPSLGYDGLLELLAVAVATFGSLTDSDRIAGDGLIWKIAAPVPSNRLFLLTSGRRSVPHDAERERKLEQDLEWRSNVDWRRGKCERESWYGGENKNKGNPPEEKSANLLIHYVPRSSRRIIPL